MATVINTTPATHSEDAGAGWAVALVVLAALIIIGLFVWPGFVRQSAAPAGGTNIDVSLPAAPAPSTPAPSIPGTDAGAGGGAGAEATP